MEPDRQTRIKSERIHVEEEPARERLLDAAPRRREAGGRVAGVAGLVAAVVGGCSAAEPELSLRSLRLPTQVVITHAGSSPDVHALFSARNAGTGVGEDCILKWTMNGEVARTGSEPEATFIAAGETRTFSMRAPIPGDSWPKGIVSEAVVVCSNGASNILRTRIGVAIE